MTTEAAATLEKDIRSYVQNVLPRYLDVDEEDAVAVLELLVETKLSEPPRMSSWSKVPKRARWAFKMGENFYFECKGPQRTQDSSRKRITYLRVGGLGKPAWNFHTERVISLLSKLECLENLCLDQCLSFRFMDAISRFPNLKSLDGGCGTSLGTTIGSLDLPMGMKASKLERLNLRSHTITSEVALATLLFDVFPSLPKLEKFYVNLNKIKSLKNIAERIRNNHNDESRIVTKSRLRHLDLGGFLGKSQGTALWMNDPEEVEALKTILCAFRELNEINGLFGLPSSRREYKEFPADISYLMEVNFTGRILVESKTEDEDNAGAPSAHSPIAPSVWPTVLARTWKQASLEPVYRPQQFENTDGIFYMLKNVRLLQEGSKRKDCRRSK